MTESTRRDFLKLTAALTAGAALSAVTPALARPRKAGNGQPNIIVLLFDAMSANNLSVYGYKRPTTPNLERFASRATVYHSHYSGGNFTSPGTGSMLTGLYPWRHRAINNDSPVRRDLVANNLFHRFGADFTRVGFAQNLWADLFLRQFHDDIDMHLAPDAFVPNNDAPLPSKYFPNDPDIAYFALDTFPFTTRQVEKRRPGSLLWGYLDLIRNAERYNPDFATPKQYPNGQPYNGYFFYEHPNIFRGVDGLIASLREEEKPFFGYFHFFSPHSPYAPRRSFMGKFEPLPLPNSQKHPLAVMNISKKEAAESRDLYDAFIADLDSEFGQTLDFLEQTGALDDSYVIVTSDHGEMFGHGEIGHGSSLLYDPVIHIPLLISAPGQTERRDIQARTSNLDFLPTLLSLAGKESTQGEGQLLPGFGGEENDNRSVYSMVAKNTAQSAPFKTGSVCLMKGEYKLIHYFGHPGFEDSSEMYSLASDPEEKRDIYAPDFPEARRLQDELLDALDSANQEIKNRTSQESESSTFGTPLARLPK
ncbi:MAG: sulfatase-like hydrolase/transferase [Chloroflexota bacterium]